MGVEDKLREAVAGACRTAARSAMEDLAGSLTVGPYVRSEDRDEDGFAVFGPAAPRGGGRPEVGPKSAGGRRGRRRAPPPRRSRSSCAATPSRKDGRGDDAGHEEGAQGQEGGQGQD